MADKQISFYAKLKDGMSKPLSDIQKKSLAFKKEMAGVNKAFAPFNQAMGESKKFLGSMAMAFAPVAIAGAAVWKVFDSIVMETARVANGMKDLSDRTQMSTEFLSILKHQGEFADVSMTDLETSLRQFSKTVSEAASGNQTALEAFDALGISIRDQNGHLKSAELLYLEFADGIKNIYDPALKTKAAIDVLGKSGQNMLIMLDQGAGGFRNAGIEAQEMGRIIDTETSVAAAKLNDNIKRMNMEWGGLKQAIGEWAIPFFADLAAGWLDFINAIKDDTLMEQLNDFIDATADIRNAEGVSGVAMSGIATQVNNMQTVVDFVGDSFMVHVDNASTAVDYLTGAVDDNAAAISNLGDADASGTVGEIIRVAGALDDASRAAAELDSWLAGMGILGTGDLDALERDLMAGYKPPKKTFKGTGSSKKEEDIPESTWDEWEREASAEAEKRRQFLIQEHVEDIERQQSEFAEFYDEVMAEQQSELDLVRQHEEQLEEIRMSGIASQEEIAALERQIFQDRIAAYGENLGAYSSIAQSMGKLTNMANKDLAKVMIPLELAQAASKLAEGTWPPNPAAIAASFQHLVAAKSWADLAKAGSGKTSKSGKGAGGNNRNRDRNRLPGEGTATAERGKGKAIVNVKEGVVTNTKDFAKSLLEQLTDAAGMDWDFEVRAA